MVFTSLHCISTAQRGVQAFRGVEIGFSDTTAKQYENNEYLQSMVVPPRASSFVE